MKKLFSRRGKVLAALLTCLLALNVCSVPVFAQEMEVFTVVPEKHSIAVMLEKGGVVIDEAGVVHTESYTAEVSHGKTLSLVLRPDSGYKLDTVLLDGQAVDVSAGRVEITHVRQDGTLRVTWKEAPASPTQKTCTIVGTVYIGEQPAAGVTLELRSKLQTGKTGVDGKFRFDEVEAGNHSLTAVYNGKAVGYLQFSLEEDGAGVRMAELPDGSFEVTMDRDVTTLRLDLLMQEDGTIKIKSAEAITGQQAEEIYPPATGDDSMIVYWLATMLAAGTTALFLVRKQRSPTIK